MNGVPLDLRHVINLDRYDLATSPIKGDLMKRVAQMRDAGHNRGHRIETRQARKHLSQVWVAGRTDHGITWLMTSSGAWVPGRLTNTPRPATWQPTGGDVEAATFAHVTSTVPDAANQGEQYRAKSNGSCGRWVRTDESVARCTCGWRSYADTRNEARAAARAHRAQHQAGVV